MKIDTARKLKNSGLYVKLFELTGEKFRRYAKYYFLYI